MALSDRAVRTVSYLTDTGGRTVDTTRTGRTRRRDDEWDRMHAALTAWKARSLMQQAIRELDRYLRDDEASRPIADRFQRAADEARTSAAVLDELDEYLQSHLRVRRPDGQQVVDDRR